MQFPRTNSLKKRILQFAQKQDHKWWRLGKCKKMLADPAVEKTLWLERYLKFSRFDQTLANIWKYSEGNDENISI